MNAIEQIAQYSSGHWVSQMVFAFVKNNMGDALEGKTLTSQAIATQCNLKNDNCYRLLRALATLGIVIHTYDDHFSLTDMGNYLTRSHPQSLVNKVLLEASYEHVMLWTHLAENLKTGELASKKVFNVDNYFDLFQTRPEHLDVFSKAMGSYTHDEIAMINAMESLDFSDIKTLVDLGGSYGDLLKAILAHNPHMQGVLFDQPAVISNVNATQRMTLEPGDFFNAVPPNCDGYFLKHILHDWDDALCIKILSNINRVMKPTSKIFIAEFGPIPEPNEPHLSKFFDIHMMLTLNGKERTLIQWQDLLQYAGFDIAKIHTSFGPLSVIEAIKRK
ncbi:methyltransferase [Pseudoalteromonas denitrificans]|uniref:Dimerisation domain-containing protein n=1 Tax=Pseudoalteromonas denitrificans DSM 6059 TaxID=1123010 RepID=A0A1I1LRW0_9GAMM|nr:methyltransferase [Pseudoalteromonas denitrificans]SFC72180.1 Dimerisation domain-containing protein [Pseudoalteromonas denitrificans DSM 6059]